MGLYKNFIEGLTGEYNAIEFGSNRGEGLEFYLSIKGLLKWVTRYANMFSGTGEIIRVDWESDKPMFLYSTSISCNLDKIYIRNEYVKTSEGTLKTNGIKPFRSITQFNTEEYSTLVEELKTQANPVTHPSIYPSLGNLNNVYVNIIYLSEALAQKSDNKDNKVTIREFLQTVCDGINKALGSINDLQVITNVDETIETLTIVDYQHKRIKGIPKPQEPTELKAQGLGSMLKTIQAQSSITPELASMISIGAQAQEQSVGEEATSFTLLSKGLTDKIYPTKRIGEDIKNLEKKEKALKVINDKFNNAISTYTLLINNQQAKDDANGPIKLASSDRSNQENIAVELYKACLGKFTQTGQTSTALIPIKLDLTLYGLAGIKIYQKFKLSNDVLPISYKGNYEFIILGVSHTVDTSKWETTISALISIRDEKIEKESKTLAPFAIPLETVSGAYSPTSAGSTRIAGETFGTSYQSTNTLFYIQGIEEQTRNQPIQDKLFNIINQAAKDNDLTVEIFSAGQDVTGTQRTGSNRHNNGYAADIWMYAASNYFTSTAPTKLKTNDGSKDEEKMKKFSQSLLKHGIHSIGAGNGYMNDVGLHVDIAIGQPGVPNARYFGKDKTSGETKTIGAAKWLSKLMVNANTKYPIKV